MKKCNGISKVFLTAVLVSSVTAAALPVSTCAAIAAASESTSVSASAASQTIKYGKVTSVGKSQIKAVLGEIQMNSPKGQNGTPPAMPQGNNTNSSNGQNGTPPAMNGNNVGFTESGKTVTISAGDISDGNIKITKMGQTASLSDISEGDILTLVYSGDSLTEIKIGIDPFGMQGGQGGMGAPHGSVSVNVTAKYTSDGKKLTASSKTLKSDTADVSVVLAKNGGKYTLKKCKLYKSGDTSSEDGSNFFGLNAVVTAETGSTVTISDSQIESDSEGSNGVFATGENAVITVKNTSITTKSNSSRGLDATLGGKVTGTNVEINTSGAHCAALATDRGGGTVKAVSSVLNTAGEGSPCIYSTGDITAVKCTGEAKNSQIAVVEGKNTVTVSGCTFTGAGKDGVMLYQSTSGDAEVGTAVFTATSSSLKTVSSGPMFYITNTDAVINLKNTKLDFSSGVLVKASGNNTNNWGTPGKNGGKLEFNAQKQTLKGDIVCDEISSVSLSLRSSSAFTGAADKENTGSVSVSLDSSSVWNVTADSYVTSLTDADSTFSNIKSNGHTVYYDPSDSANSALGGKTITLADGGKIAPIK